MASIVLNNPNLEPETSKSGTIGFVFEPVAGYTVSLDYWNIKLKDKINALPEEAIYGNYAKYQERVASLRDAIARSEQNVAALQREIANIR